MANKLLVFLLSTFVLNVAVANDFEETFLKGMMKATLQCIGELKIPYDPLSFKHEKMSNETQACLFECTHSKTGIIKDGKFDIEGMRNIQKLATGDSKEGMEQIENVYKLCVAEEEKYRNEKCHTGRALLNCINSWRIK